MSTAARCEEELHTLWMMLDIEFMALKPSSYQEAADQLLDNILWKERIRKGLESTEEEQAISDWETLEKIRAWDTNDPQLAALEKVLHRLATNRGGEAMRVVENRTKAGRSNPHTRTSVAARLSEH